MSRLSTDAIKQALLHPDRDVRQAALHYFADAHSLDPTVMPVVIEAFARWQAEAFDRYYPISSLVQTETTVQWIVEELTIRSELAVKNWDYWWMLVSLLANIDPSLVQPHEASLQTSPAFGPEALDNLKRRIGNAAKDSDTLWRELEAHADALNNEQEWRDYRWSHADEILDELARQGDRNAARMMEILQAEIVDTDVQDYDETPMALLRPSAIRLAGKLRYKPAIPLLLTSIQEDDFVAEDSEYALGMIVTDSLVQTLWDAAPTGEPRFRMSVAMILGEIHSDLAVQASIALLKSETDLDVQEMLADSLVGQFSTEGNEAVRTLSLEDSFTRRVRNALVTACALMGQDFPELEGWRKEIEEDKKPKPPIDLPSYNPRAWVPLPPMPPPSVYSPVRRNETRVGRNDPCPCGSGKKYKKCCMVKDNAG